MVEEDYHNCHFCGEFVKDGFDSEGERHWLSDCRPDLVQHEPGKLCTWHGQETVIHGQPPKRFYDCYAYQDRDTNGWGGEHIHFYKDGPM